MACSPRPPLWSPFCCHHCLPIICLGVPSVPNIICLFPLPSIMMFPLCSVSFALVAVLFWHLSWCANCSFTCPGVPSFLSIMCPCVLLVLSAISRGDPTGLLSVLVSNYIWLGVLLVYFLPWCPLCAVYHLSSYPLCSLSYHLSRYNFCSLCHLSWCSHVLPIAFQMFPSATLLSLALFCLFLILSVLFSSVPSIIF